MVELSHKQTLDFFDEVFLAVPPSYRQIEKSDS